MKRTPDVADRAAADGAHGFAASVEDAATNGASAKPGPPPLLVPDPWECILLMGQRGPRLATGYPTLDEATRGGIPVGQRIVIGSHPQGGKTTFVVNLLHTWLCAGHFVGILAADEPRDGILLRLGQLLGYSRDLLEEDGRHPEKMAVANAERRQYAEHVEAEFGPRLLVVDPEEDSPNDSVIQVEAVSTELRRRRDLVPGALSILFIDSLQTASTEGTEAARDEHARLRLIIRAHKTAAKRDRHLAIALSENNRDSWAAAAGAGKRNQLAAFKGSSDIEFRADIALIFLPVEKEEDLIDVLIVKNRLRGAKSPSRLRLKLNRTEARLSEIPKPTDEEVEREELARDDRMRAAVIEIVSKAPQPLSTNALLQRIKTSTKSRELRARRQDWYDLIRTMHDEGDLARKGGRQGGYTAPEAAP